MRKDIGNAEFRFMAKLCARPRRFNKKGKCHSAIRKRPLVQDFQLSFSHFERFTIDGFRLWSTRHIEEPLSESLPDETLRFQIAQKLPVQCPCMTKIKSHPRFGVTV